MFDVEDALSFSSGEYWPRSVELRKSVFFFSSANTLTLMRLCCTVHPAKQRLQIEASKLSWEADSEFDERPGA